jgi:hypothetical protein
MGGVYFVMLIAIEDRWPEQKSAIAIGCGSTCLP